MSDFLRRFARDFAALDKTSLHRLGTLYSDDAVFTDPLHKIRGLANMQDYFAQLYANVTQLHFDFYAFDEVATGSGYLRWTMSYAHPRLANGRLIRVDGCSHLLWRDKVYQHRDYFDAGALLYEHLPIMGRGISWLKGRLA
ncbi:nuclear transport factor 2 family protein [Pseudomonas sp. G.S.17]|uniref:nuclear transport factor 2 family protein n=1 Tax=Pseudomonas sp. G.S.17 TaxID=3137451 RepID=UPI00311CC7A6